MKEYDQSTKLWNQVFEECKMEDLTKEELNVEPLFDECLNLFTQGCNRILDFGCGSGDILFQCMEYKHLTYGMGIDRSDIGIKYCKDMAQKNHYHQLEFLTGGTELIEQMEEGTFDGVILSNVLDVVPKKVASNILMNVTRVLSPGGYMFVKLNPYYTKEQLKEFGYVKMKDNLYEENGILRLRQVDTITWHQIFNRHFEIERYLEFPYPWQEGMNRLFLLKKR